MQNAIKAIIDEIPSGRIFDSHYVINRLIKEYSDNYLTYASNIDSNSNKTLVVHGNIGKEIAKFNNTIIRQLSDLSWSENIHGKSNDCACWQKI